MPVLLVVLLIGVPILELWVLGQVAGFLGWPTTLVILLLTSIAGAWLLRQEGTRAWQRFSTTLGEGRVPAKEIVDGVLILLGGVLLLTPGFTTDVVGLLCILTPTRALLNGLLRARALALVPGPLGTLISFGSGPAGRAAARARRRRAQPGPRARTRPTRTTGRAGDQPIDVEIVDVRRTPPPEDGDPAGRG